MSVNFRIVEIAVSENERREWDIGQFGSRRKAMRLARERVGDDTATLVFRQIFRANEKRRSVLEAAYGDLSLAGL